MAFDASTYQFHIVRYGEQVRSPILELLGECVNTAQVRTGSDEPRHDSVRQPILA